MVDLSVETHNLDDGGMLSCWAQIPTYPISTAKIKQCYGVIAWALSIAGYSTERRLTQALARETTAENFIRGDKTTP